MPHRTDKTVFLDMTVRQAELLLNILGHYSHVPPGGRRSILQKQASELRAEVLRSVSGPIYDHHLNAPGMS
jgi:hypothetical protein